MPTTDDDKNVMRHGQYLGCGRPNFRHNRCRDAYLGRRCDGCDPDKQTAAAEQPAAEPAPAKKTAAAKKTGG